MRFKENTGVSMVSSPCSTSGTALSITNPTSSPPHTSIMGNWLVYDGSISESSGAISRPYGPPSFLATAAMFPQGLLA
ncbi:hypothetical protein FOWG_17184 [Fusarium oxysporum f. sp. lycopersici MN25]|nr:hypothetical protein FOWG_17184 [Fusarium oxysporum f. sp. lycopersici MN25]